MFDEIANLEPYLDALVESGDSGQDYTLLDAHDEVWISVDGFSVMVARKPGGVTCEIYKAGDVDVPLDKCEAWADDSDDEEDAAEDTEEDEPAGTIVLKPTDAGIWISPQDPWWGRDKRGVKWGQFSGGPAKTCQICNKEITAGWYKSAFADNYAVCHEHVKMEGA